MALGLWALHAVGARARPEESRNADDPIHRIRHVIVIMQENRSFDSYFGTFPGADGIPMRNRDPLVCKISRLVAICFRLRHHEDVCLTLN